MAEQATDLNFFYPSLLESVKEVQPDIKSKVKILGFQSDRFRENKMSSSAEAEMKDAKQRDRSYMSREDWYKGKFSKTNWCQLLKDNCPDDIERIDYQKVSESQFIEQYESKNKPCIIQNTTLHLNVKKYWTFQAIYDRYKDVAFKIGEDDKGKKIRVKLKYFFEYLLHNQDDSPLYMFESAVEDIKEARKMIDTYDVPKYFREDIFESIGEKKRPPYRWFLIGPERSGTTVHIDPMYTSAWNTSLQGYKRWVLFDPKVPKSIVKAKKYLNPGDEDDAIQYFTKILPLLVREEGREKLGIIEFLQKPGETVFIPGGWWHAVINVTDSVAVTQNFMNSVNIPLVWPSFRKERKKLSCYAMRKFAKHLPLIHQRLLSINSNDGFKMFEDRKPLQKKLFAEDDALATTEKREPFDITSHQPRHFSSDYTSKTSSSSSSISSSSSESDRSRSPRHKKRESSKRKRNSNSLTHSR